MLSAGIAFFTSLQTGEAERRAAKLKEFEIRAALGQEREREERDLLRTPAKSHGATFCAFLAVMTGCVSFFTAMGGTIALVLGEDEGGVVALIVSGFFMLATLILLGMRRHLERRAALRNQERIGPIHSAPSQPSQGPVYDMAPVYPQTAPLVIEDRPAPQRPNGEDPLPRA